MKAITIHQPWASLIALGYKQFETRSWSPAYRGPILIHAGKSAEHIIAMSRYRELGITDGESDWRALAWKLLLQHYYAPSDLPRGCVVGIANLIDVWKSDEIPLLGVVERRLGDFTPGRYGWRLDNAKPVVYTHTRGAQGLWEWKYSTPAVAPAPVCRSRHGQLEAFTPAMIEANVRAAVEMWRATQGEDGHNDQS